MAVFDNLQGTYSSGIAPEVRKYYDRTLLKEAEANLVHQRDLQKKTLPLNSGKTVQLRKFHAFKPAPVPLQEGVTPAPQSMKVTEQHITVKPYGDYIEYTDELNLTTIDDMVKESASRLARSASETLDMIAADALNGGLNVIYANGTSRADIGAGDVLTSTLIKKAVRALEKANAQRFPDGYYHAIVDPETKYDLTADPMWVDIAKYQNSEKWDKYELGKMLGVKFYETTMTKMFNGEDVLWKFGTNSSHTRTELALNGGKFTVATGTGYVTIDKLNIPTVPSETLTMKESREDYACRQLVGKTVKIGTAAATGKAALIDQCYLDGGNIKCTLRFMDTTTDYTYSSGDKMFAQEAGDVEVHSTILYAQDFAGSVNLGGNGGEIQSILNAPGSSGAADPLAQRGTIGWKVRGYAVSILQDAYGVRIEHAVSQ